MQREFHFSFALAAAFAAVRLAATFVLAEKAEVFHSDTRGVLS